MNAPPVANPFASAPALSAAQLDGWILAYLRHAPLALCLRELNRLLALQILCPTLGPHVLDVGCGDGFWWTLRDRGTAHISGVDISPKEVAQASGRIEAVTLDISRERPFPGRSFNDFIGNCSLEHVPDVDAALVNMRAAAAPRARLVLFVPAVQWAYQGRVQSLLLQHAPRVAMMTSGAINGFFQHWHLYTASVWRHLLARTGWRVEASYGLGNPQCEFLFRLLLPQALVSFTGKKLTGAYPSRLFRYVPDGALAPLCTALRRALHDPIVTDDAPTAYEYVLVAEANP